MSLDVHSEILLLGQTLSIDESVREVCPSCGGGTSGERSLSVTRDSEGIVYQCFRAKCGITGASGQPSGAAFSEKKIKKQTPKWEGTTYPIPEKVAAKIRELWGFEDIPRGWYWTTDYGGRVAMSVVGPKGQHRGWVLRALSSQVRVKALTFINENEEGMSWYKTQLYAPTVLVEDIPSALRASRYVNTVALLGTGVGLDRATEIATYSHGAVVVALDQDATSLAFKWARKYALMWGDVSVLPLTKDLKNMTEEELQRTLNYEGTACTQ